MENDKQYLERGFEYLKKALQKLELQTLCDHLPPEKFTKIVENIYREQGLVVEDKKAEALKAARTVKIKNCPFCQFPIKQESEVLVCSACKIPHHQECWEENGGCTTFGCKGKTAASAMSGRTQISDRISLDGAGLSAESSGYVIDSISGEIHLADLEIGARVVDPSWQWQFRLGVNYSNINYRGDPTPAGEVNPVTWIVVAKDHYDGLEPHVTLLSEELIGRYIFDDSTNRGDHNIGANHWGNSGTPNATGGLRPWLNSTGIHRAQGIYNIFSDNFKSAILTTNLTNYDFVRGRSYITSDKVFIPSATELGDTKHSGIHSIGTVYPYFKDSDDVDRVAIYLDESWMYWTRTPISTDRFNLIAVYPGGSFYSNAFAKLNYYGYRPALNLKANTLVTKLTDKEQAE